MTGYGPLRSGGLQVGPNKQQSHKYNLIVT